MKELEKTLPIIKNLVRLGITSLAFIGELAYGQFFVDSPEYRNLALDNYVDVVYPYAPHNPGNGGTFSSGKLLDVAKGFWTNAEQARRQALCRTRLYQLFADLETPRVSSIIVDDHEFLSKGGIVIQVEGQQGKRYRSDLSRGKARHNVWRAGYYYYDSHLMDFQLTSESGDTLPCQAEFVMHAYPDKIHVEARLTLPRPIGPKSAAMICNLQGPLQKASAGWLVKNGDGVQSLAILGGEAKATSLTVPLTEEDESDGVLSGHLVFIPEDGSGTLEARLEREANPLGPEAFEVSDGLYVGYDAATGFYRLRNIKGIGSQHFSSFYRNPNMYLSTSVGIRNSGDDRKIYICHSADAGAIESAVLTDESGFPHTVRVQCSKNFGGEGEEPVDMGFSESYFPIELKADEQRAFKVLHLHQNWGNHALRQVSSIRFFQIYYHLSQGVTETTCFALPMKFGNTPDLEPRAYTLADYRPLSGQTWLGQPQHHHVALGGWLQYLDAEENWRYPVYQGSEILSAGPNLAWFTLNYVTSDGKVDMHLEIFEMPQADESRTHVRARYTINDDVTIAGNIAQNFRLLNNGSYIRKLSWKELAWTSPDGEVRTHPMTNDGQWSLVGEEIRPYNSFAAAYPNPDGNPAFVVRQISGKVNGKSFSRIGLSAVGHEDGKSELMLVPLVKGNTLKRGSVFEIDCVLIPYGDNLSNWRVPYQESMRFGLNKDERQTVSQNLKLKHSSEKAVGPSLTVMHGTKVMNLPPIVKAKDNYATVRWEGAHDRISLVATGFSNRKYPMLWEGDAWLDPQVRGHDGIQAFENRDGTYGFVFAPQARTTRVSGEWGTKPFTFHVTQALSSSDIESISALNGRVRITQMKPGKLDLISPRLWCPARHTWLDSSLSKMTSQSQVVTTVPMQIQPQSRPRAISIETYSPDRIELQVSAPQAVHLTMGGLLPGALYRQEMDNQTKEVKTDRRGNLTLTVAGTVDPVSIRITDVKQ